MKIGLYSPFLAENIGGGERYLLTVAECLLPNHEVDLIVPGNYDLNRLKQKFIANFRLRINKLNLVNGPFGAGTNANARLNFTRTYDVFYYMTDGSFFISLAKLNVVHFMIPFNRPPSWLERWKMSTWKIKTANSFFTKKSLERLWRIKINYVHWGAVDDKLFRPGKKTNQILNVGRFFSPLGHKHCKRQDFLVETFKLMCDQGLKGWQLVFNGPVDSGQDNREYYESVKAGAQGYPIIFHNQGSFKILQADYAGAKIYWHAAGHEIDEKINPQAVEHLGMSTVEAMAAGAVPVVIGKGGQPEIVRPGDNGYLWQDQNELVKQTLAVMKDEVLRQKIAANARLIVREFSQKKFCQTTEKMFRL